MAGILRLNSLGRLGVILDSDDLHTPPGAFRSAQNFFVDPLGSSESVVNRPGLIAFTTSTAAGAIKGGIGVPLPDLHTSSTGSETRYFFISRGTA